MRSLRKCHLPSRYERPRHAPPKDTGAYVPAMAARLDNDPNLTDGARRCARKIMEETHRRDRKERKLLVNVSYLAKGLAGAGAPYSATSLCWSAKAICAPKSCPATAPACASG